MEGEDDLVEVSGDGNLAGTDDFDGGGVEEGTAFSSLRQRPALRDWRWGATLESRKVALDSCVREGKVFGGNHVAAGEAAGTIVGVVGTGEVRIVAEAGGTRSGAAELGGSEFIGGPEGDIAEGIEGEEEAGACGGLEMWGVAGWGGEAAGLGGGVREEGEEE